MIRLEVSPSLGRKIRRDMPAALAMPTWGLVAKAVQTGKVDEALEFMKYGCAESQAMHDALVSIIDDAITHLARFGEAEIPQLFRRSFYPLVKDWPAVTPSVEETLQRCAEFQRSHFSEFTVLEEPDRYVMRCDPCGSGGRLRRSKKGVGITQKPYPWSWGKRGIPYYCTHCCVAWEMIPIELWGYPLRITEVSDKPEDPCIQYFYKKPELIPERYFARIGKAKTIR